MRNLLDISVEAVALEAVLLWAADEDLLYDVG